LWCVSKTNSRTGTSRRGHILLRVLFFWDMTPYLWVTLLDVVKEHGVFIFKDLEA
jgi:hypothetical protein